MSLIPHITRSMVTVAYRLRLELRSPPVSALGNAIDDRSEGFAEIIISDIVGDVSFREG